mgnify:CR=1 FL=1
MQGNQHNPNQHSKTQLPPQRAHRPVDDLPSRNPHTRAAHTIGSYQQRLFPAGLLALSIRKSLVRRLRLSPDHRPPQLDFLAVAQDLHAQLGHTVDSGERVGVGSAHDRPLGVTGSIGKPHRDHLARSRPLLAYHQRSWTSQGFSTAARQLRRTHTDSGTSRASWAHPRHSDSGGNVLTFQDQLARPSKRRPGWGPTGAARQSCGRVGARMTARLTVAVS